MDRVRTTTRASRIKLPATITSVAFALISGGVMLGGIDFNTGRVDRTQLSIETVQRGTMEIKVGANGQLRSKRIEQAINVEVGQQRQPRSPIGRIAQQNQLYAELTVPARKATQVQAGQKVLVDTRNGTVNGIVSRVDPGVTEGTVVVDVDLEGVLPAGARPQLQVEGIIYTIQLADTLYVGKPAYVKNDAAIAVYKLDPAGRYATRTTIKVGKVSLSYLQVLHGLQAGDRVITSETGAWQDQERVLLK